MFLKRYDNNLVEPYLYPIHYTLYPIKLIKNSIAAGGHVQFWRGPVGAGDEGDAAAGLLARRGSAARVPAGVTLRPSCTALHPPCVALRPSDVAPLPSCTALLPSCV